jgi:medium-chain acyl-[acyl-carrier-protein] hydrolase
MISTDTTSWVPYRRPRQKPTMRLFCFPHAGAGGYIFRDWAKELPDEIDVCAIEPPGKLARLTEKRIYDLHRECAMN